MYQLGNGKVIYLSIEQYLDLTDLDIQYLISQDSGDHIIHPFADSAINKNTKETYYDFDDTSDDDISYDNPLNDHSFDDIVDLSDPTDI